MQGIAFIQFTATPRGQRLGPCETVRSRYCRLLLGCAPEGIHALPGQMTAETNRDRTDQALPKRKQVVIRAPLVTAVGIGCLWFGVMGDEDDDDIGFDPKTHLQNFKEALESVDNISDVEAEGNTRSRLFPGQRMMTKVERQFHSSRTRLLASISSCRSG